MKLSKLILLVFLMLFLQGYVFASEINPYQIIIKLKNMPEAASLSAIQPHLNDLETTLGLKISAVKPMGGGAYVFAFEPEQIQQLAKKQTRRMIPLLTI